MATMAENVIIAGKENGQISLKGADGVTDETPTQTIDDLSPKENLRYDIDIKNWSRFVTTAKQARNLHVVNFDQLYAFLKHNKKDAKEVREMRQRFPDSLALLANTYNPPHSYSSQRLPTQATIQNGQVMVQNVQGRQYQGYAVNTRKSQATGARVINTFGQENANQPSYCKCNLHNQSSPAGSINGDIVASTYDSDILSEVPHYDTYHETDVLNSDVQETVYIEHIVINNNSYNELTRDINVISYTNYMAIIEHDATQYIPPPTQENDMILSVIEKMKSQVERCNTVNQEAKSVNESLTKARALKPLDEHIGHASKFTERIQELLVYVSASCPFTESGNEKWAPATSYRKNNKPYIDACRTKQTDVNNTQKHDIKQDTQKTDNTMLPSTGRVSYTDATRLKPKRNTKNDRIKRPSSRSKENKVEAQLRKFKSCSNKNNQFLDYNANVKNVSISNNSKNVCLSCNACLFSANHDACVVKHLKDVQKHKKAKYVKQKEKIQWKPTGRVFTSVGLKWKWK
ncbi:hypothetical protein Tco_0325116 [Tanacetum coccineum]